MRLTESRYFGTALSLLLSATCAAVVGQPSLAAACDVTPYQPLLPEVVAPMAGKHPIWLVTGAGTDSSLWIRPECGVKTQWVVARGVEGDLIVQGKRLDGPGELTFRRGQSERSSSLLIANAARERGVRPGGAPSRILDEYVFWPSLVFYPSIGCWELTARIGASQVRIVQHLTPSIMTDCAPEEAPQ